MKKLIIGAAAFGVIAGCAHGGVKEKADMRVARPLRQNAGITALERARCFSEGWAMVMMPTPTDAAASVEYWDRLGELNLCAFPKQEQGEDQK